MMKRRTLQSLLSTSVVAGVVATACGPAGFTSSSVIDSVRILATRADNDKSYAKPGDTVTVEALMVDGRPNKSPPAVMYWIPFVCENPIDDAYYGCFASLIGGDAGTGGQPPSSVDGGNGGGPEDAGEDAGSLDGGEDAGAPTPPLSPVIPPGELPSLFTAGTDITPYLPTGSFTFKVPADAIATHPVVAGAPAPYGLIILFNIACTGRVVTLPLNPAAGPQQVPIGCDDSSGNPLGPDQYVIGFTRVYVYATKTNLNPVITGFLFNGQEVYANDAGGGNPSPISVTMPACSGSDCNGVPIDMDVPASSYTPQPKSIWVDYFTLGGNLNGDARLLYDLNAGRVSDSNNQVTYSDDAGTATTLWAVVHDSNDGVTWLQVNVAAP
jgi:hypothetical protein